MKTTLQILIVSAALALLGACSTTQPQKTANSTSDNANWKGFPRGPAPNSNNTMTSAY